jgi:hypothetical protein
MACRDLHYTWPPQLAQLRAAGLAQNKYFDDPAFVNYLQYLGYWRQPEWAKFLQCVHVWATLAYSALAYDVDRGCIGCCASDQFSMLEGGGIGPRTPPLLPNPRQGLHAPIECVWTMQAQCLRLSHFTQKGWGARVVGECVQTWGPFKDWLPIWQSTSLAVCWCRASGASFGGV